MLPRGAEPVGSRCGWDAVARSIENGFEIERKEASSRFTPIATVRMNVTRYSDAGLRPQTTYTYRVQAINARWELRLDQ